MKLTINTGEISLPEGFTFEIESNHPFFSDEGTASVPVTIPSSEKNLRLLGYPQDARRTKRHVKEQLAYFQAGSFVKKCLLITESAGKSSGISATLALYESDMYADMQDRRLPDILAGFSRRVSSKVLLEINGPNKVFHCTAEWGFLNDEVAIFPVATDMDSDGNVFILNDLDEKFDLKESARTVDIGGESVSVPAGYGVTPFLYLGVMLRLVFSECGYDVRNNPFATDDTLKRIVVVNNCADANCTYDYTDSWIVNYSDLVPDITVGELMAFLHDSFGAYVTCESGTVDIRLIKDDITTVPDADLSSYSLNDDSVSYPEPSCLKRSFDTSLDHAEPAADTMQDLRNMYESMTNVDSESDISSTGLYFVPVLGRYFHKPTVTSEVSSLGTNCFTYYRDLNVSAEEISAETRFLPMVRVKYSINGSEGVMYIPYIGNRIHRYLDLVKAADDQKQPLQICYAHKNALIKYTSGSSYSYDLLGLLQTDGSQYPKSYPALTPEGLNSYWREYETFLVDGAPEINVTMDIPVRTLTKIDRYVPKLYKNGRVMIKSMSYAVDGSETVSVKMVLWALPEYDDGVYIPPTIIFNTSLVWQLVSTRTVFADENTEILKTDGLSDYTAEDAPSYKPSKAAMIAGKRSRQLWYRRYYDSYFQDEIHTWTEYFISVLKES